MTFRKGQSGNPKGRPKGRKTTAQALRERITERAGEVLDTVVDAALAGNLLAAQLLLSRCIPPARGQAVPVELPALAVAGTLTEKADAVLAAVGAGELAADTGAQLLGALGTVAKIRETDELEARIRALEARDAPQP
ncbi:DUF5681 domain-containing protein [Plasticicumulans sp.]|uniref:DUF5681 domain-containing protein n=1 Tax=Plasticicumulans sp. TaxID=2307179 RepID=UPI0032203910